MPGFLPWSIAWVRVFEGRASPGLDGTWVGSEMSVQSDGSRRRPPAAADVFGVLVGSQLEWSEDRGTTGAVGVLCGHVWPFVSAIQMSRCSPF